MSQRRRIITVVSVVAILTTVAAAKIATGGGGETPGAGTDVVTAVNARLSQSADLSGRIGSLRVERQGIYSTRRGDRANVDLLVGNGSMRCLSVGGDRYSSAVSCFDLNEVAESGAYVVAVPLVEGAPSLVVGITPVGKPRIVIVGSPLGVTARDRIYMSELPAATDGQVAIQYRAG